MNSSKLLSVDDSITYRELIEENTPHIIRNRHKVEKVMTKTVIADLHKIFFHNKAAFWQFPTIKFDTILDILSPDFNDRKY